MLFILAGTAQPTNYSQPPPTVPSGGYGSQSGYDSSAAPPSNQYSGYGSQQQGGYGSSSYGGQGGYSSMYIFNILINSILFT
jgi:hypothetical protein